MGSISASIELYDKMSAPLHSIMTALNQTIATLYDMNDAMATGIDTSSLDSARNAINQANASVDQLTQELEETGKQIQESGKQQDNFNNKLAQGVNNSSNLLDKITGLAGAYLTVKSVKGVLDASDELISTTARLNTMNSAFDEINDTSTDVNETIQKIYASAQNARGSFSDMAALVAKFGNNARDAFADSDEVVAFANLIQKQMTIAGASTQEASNAMLQLSQALGSGVLRGDELNSIFEQAPNLIQSIADYMDVPIGQIRDMASEGQITADIVKAAIFDSADEIESKFNNMPMTWSQVWASFQNSALMAFQPVLNKINELARNNKFQTFVSRALGALSSLANFALSALETIGSVATFIYDNWSIIEPLVLGVVAALAAYAVVSGVVAAINAVAAASELTKKAASELATDATLAETAAQYGLNAALAACPLTWIIVLVIAIVAAVIAFCSWVAKATGVAQTGIGVIVGALAVAVAFVGNLLVSLVNYAIDYFSVLWNFIAAFANFFGNVFNDPIGSIARLFFDLADTVMSILQSIASAIDTLFGSNLAGAVQGWRDSLGGWVDDKFGEGEEIMATIDSSDYHLDRFNYGDAFDAGAAWGDGAVDKVSGAFDSLTDNSALEDLMDTFSYDTGASLDEIGDSAASTADSASSVADSVDISEENLKYLRDIAETEAINRFTTAEITVNQTNNNSVASGTDIDGMITSLTDGVNEAMAMAAEGVH